MNILIQSDDYTPRHAPAAIRMQVFSTVFQEKGNHVVVLASKESFDGGSLRAQEAVYCPAIPLKKKTSFYRMANQLSYALTSFFKGFTVGKTDVVITTSPPVLISMFGWLIAKCKKAKLVYDVRDIWPDVALEMGSFSEKSPYCKLFRFISGFMFKHADVITTVSPGKVEKIKDKLPGNQRQKVWLVSNGIDESFLNQPEDKSVIEKYHLRDKFTCVYFGNIGLAQGLGNLLNLAEKTDLEKYQFLIFGKGAEKQTLAESAARRGLTNVKFYDTVDAQTVYSVLCNASMTYIPLVNANLKDSIPTKTYEALGAGCPILMVAEGDAPKIVQQSRLGMTLSPDDIEQLPDAFQKFVDAYPEYIAQRNHAREYVLQECSRQKITLAFEHRLSELMK